ncbi:TIGR02611 family protein [Streptomyces sp. NRRL S-350]|uniref:TIGR02611 family protein n=1 Tax=Streptomyces sp. NRRL S-350 TaxID=1463902 RepID=UPI0004C18201|nr:TIGR02611 family protein [Streptomyces sp. NRRL S-350]
MTVRNDKTAENTRTGEAATADDGAAGGRAVGSRAPAFARRSPALHRVWQAVVFLAGLAVVGLGVVMLPLPGPGWVVIFLGMGLWATEFVWAQLVLRWTRRKVAEAARRAMDPRVRRRNLVITATGLAVIAVAGGWYLARYGLVAPWRLGGR